MPDQTLLSWINAEVERALVMVRDSIAKFSAAPGNAEALRQCPEHLHQVSGALRMVGLNGATLVCETIEGSFANGQPNAKAVGVIDRAVLALKEFIGDLARGQADTPMRLYPVYRDLAQLQGTGAVSEKDLFFPNLSLKAPAHRSPKTIPTEQLAAHLHKQRALFQRGLLSWLRKPPAGLDEMRRAVNHLHKVAAQLPEPRGIWWVAHGFLDALDNPPDKEWLAAAKALGTRIERQMSVGEKTVSEALLRELLYAIAKCPPATPRQKEIRSLYQLDSLFPRAEAAAVSNVMEFDIERLEVALYDLHSRLDALKRAWVQYVSGEHKTAAHFRELVSGFKAKARDLGNPHFVKLLDAIAVVSPKLPDPYPRTGQAMVIEMASTFLLVEYVIDHFTAPTPDLDQQISIMGGWLLDAATGKSSGEPPPGLRADFGERIGALQLRAQVAKEILANLQHVEQVLDAFARDPSKRAALADLQPYMRQMNGALVVLEFKRAAEALSICESMVAACAAEGHAKVAEDMDWIAEGLSSLGFFLEPCRHGREPVEEAIELFFRRYEKRNTPVSAETTSLLKSPVKGAKPEAARPSVDADLLQVYLEEAEEVLQTIEQTIPECRSNPEDRESLTTLRRAFHTLKGSGRMVGLMDLGEAAWEVEQIMNLWLEEKRPASPALLEFVGMAQGAFAGWIAQLRDNRLVREIDGKPIVEGAARLKQPQAAQAELAPAAPADEVTVGEVTLPRNFFDIYIKEAAQHVAELEAQCAEWRKTPGSAASEEFMRAAHTLASSSRTAGFREVADLAGVLEHWTALAPQTTADQAAVEGAIIELRAMVELLSRQQAPAPAMTATQELRSLVARLEANPPPPVEAKVPAPAAAPAPAEAGGREKRVMRDDIDQQLLPVFLEEAEELVPHLGSDLRDWKANPADQNVSDSLRRILHTLKGSARMAGAIRLGELCHLMETRVEAALEAKAFPPALFEDLEEKMDRVSTDVERMRVAPAPAPAPVAQVQAPAPVQKPRVEAPLPAPAGMLRVNADILDHLINESGEVAIARSRIEAELRVVKQSLSDLGDSVTRLRTQLREVEVQADSQMQSRQSVMDEKKGEYDPLEFDRYTRLQELTRLMAESLSDVGSIQQTLLKNLGDTDAALLQQGRIGREVQQELMRIRAVPFTNLNERLYRIVRQTARDLDKKVELTVEGGELELDRSVLERIGAPLEHMLRNAMAHGIEAPAARVAAGKPESGRISIALRQESNEMVMIITDDGGGLDLERLRAKGVAMGLMRADEEKTDAEIAQFVFVSGLSTAEQVSELAGRGVGMDVVKAEISAIGGRIDILTTRGGGTTFTVYLPLTLAVTQAVLVRCGASVLAISSAMVEQVLRVKSEALTELYAAQSVTFQDRVYPLHYARHLLGTAIATEIQPYNSVLLLRSGVQRIALHIDELLANQEVVVKAIGPQLARVPGVVGATVLADGAIVLIVNPVLLAGRVRGRAERTLSQPLAPVEAAPQQLAPTIMVVDDSLTVRKFTTRLLEREGYRVATAKDGVDALEQLKDALPSVMLVDIEMPRMDGFDLTRNLRADPRTQQIPIIVISSRTAEKHRTHAASLGVNAFLGKPYPESELLQLIAQYARA